MITTYSLFLHTRGHQCDRSGVTKHKLSMVQTMFEYSKYHTTNRHDDDGANVAAEALVGAVTAARTVVLYLADLAGLKRFYVTDKIF